MGSKRSKRLPYGYNERKTVMAYPVSTWAKVKADYETGNFTIEKLWKKYGIAAVTIETKIIKKKWIKGSSAPAIQQTIAEKNIAMFAKLGMTTEDLAQKLINGLNTQEKAAKEIAEKINNSDVDIEMYTKLIPQILDDRKISLEYAKEIIKMIGVYAPAKKETEHSGSINMVQDEDSNAAYKKRFKQD